MNGLEPLIPIVPFLTIGAVAIFRGPFGRALSERIATGGRDAVGPEPVELRGAVEEIRYRLTDVEERLDFTERVLTRGGGAGGPPGAE